MEHQPELTPELASVQAQIAILKAQAEIARIIAGGIDVSEAEAPFSPIRDLSPLGRSPH
jgi:hypothetical protein